MTAIETLDRQELVDARVSELQDARANQDRIEAEAHADALIARAEEAVRQDAILNQPTICRLCMSVCKVSESGVAGMCVSCATGDTVLGECVCCKQPISADWKSPVETGRLFPTTTGRPQPGAIVDSKTKQVKLICPACVAQPEMWLGQDAVERLKGA